MVPQSDVRRRFIPNEPDPSNIPLPDSSDSSLSNNSQPPDIPVMPRNYPLTTAKGHQDEVQVMPHHGPMSKIIEDYHTIKLNYYTDETAFTATVAPNTFQDRIFRLNSIFDVFETRAGNQAPLGRDTWASIYQYYRVLGCDMEVKIVNRNNTTTLLAGIVLEEDNVNLTVQRENFMMRKNAIRAIIPGNNFMNPSIAKLTYNYAPQSWDHHVQETGIEERWTPIGESPSNQHRAILRILHSSNANKDLDYEIYVQMKFTVQFREANKTILTTGSIPA
jgi:hypothetical protein